MAGLDEEAGMSGTQPTAASRRRAQPSRGVALGLEDEVEFGSDEDLMDTIGEIEVTSSGGWYPGMPDLPSQSRSKTKVFDRGSGFNTRLGASASKVSLSSQSTGKSRPSILGRHKDRNKGLGDAKLVMPQGLDAAALGLSTGSDRYAQNGHSRQVSEDSMTSSKMTGSSMSLATSGKKGERKGMFGRMFGKKRDDEILSVGSVRSLESITSFGSGRYSEDCA